MIIAKQLTEDQMLAYLTLKGEGRHVSQEIINEIGRKAAVKLMKFRTILNKDQNLGWKIESDESDPANKYPRYLIFTKTK
jgi:hypothetical protein